jgi:hypothetical protein
MNRKTANDAPHVPFRPHVFLSTDAIGRLFRYLTFCERHKSKLLHPEKALQNSIISLLAKEKSYEDNHLVSEGWELMNRLLLIQEASDYRLALFTSETVKYDFQLLVLEDCRERKLARDFVRPPAYSRLQYCQLNDASALKSADEGWNKTMEDLQDCLRLTEPVEIVRSDLVEVASLQTTLGKHLIIDPSDLSAYVCALAKYVDFVVTYDVEFSTLLSNLREGDDWAAAADTVLETVLQNIPEYSSYASDRPGKKGTAKQQLREALPRAGNATSLGSWASKRLLESSTDSRT